MASAGPEARIRRKAGQGRRFSRFPLLAIGEGESRAADGPSSPILPNSGPYSLLFCVTPNLDPPETCAILRKDPTQCRDGGTGRRSGLKIRRPLRSWGFDPPSRHHEMLTLSASAYFTFKTVTAKGPNVNWSPLSVPVRGGPSPVESSTDANSASANPNGTVTLSN